jgi:16S rRNA (guanine1207-N2)-methyltransferase
MDIRKFSVRLADEQITVFSTLGLAEWHIIAPSVTLLAKCSDLQSANQVLLLGCDLGALSVHIARLFPQPHLTIIDQNFTALEMCRQTLAANGIELGSVNILAAIELPPDLQGSLDAVLMLIPKGRSLSRRWLLQALHALKSAGHLYLAGSNRAGIQSIIKDAGQLFGNGRVLAYKKGNRVAEYTRQPFGEPTLDWVSFPGVAPHTWVEFPVTLAGRTLTIHSLPGIFSYDHVDEGTGLLLANLHIPEGARVLDVGCGYGIIGCSAAIQGASLVHLVDNNLLAVAACRESLALNHITNAEVFCGDLLDPLSQHRYDLILSNPPFHSGHAIDYQIAQAMIRQSYQALSPGGQLVIVANRFIRYEHLIEDVYGNVSILAKSGKFHLLSGLKSS